MNYDSDRCTLSRSFGEGEDKIVAQFARYEPGAKFDLSLIGGRLKTSMYPSVDVLFGPAGRAVRSNAMAGFAGGAPALFLYGRLDNIDRQAIDFAAMTKTASEELIRLNRIDPSIETTVTSLSVRINGRAILLELGSMGPPMAAMRKCTADLLQTWGLSSDEQERLTRPILPKTNPGLWITQADFPSRGAARGEQAIIHFRLMVDASGFPTSCTIQGATLANSSFAETTCALLKQRARFDPAWGATGMPIPSYYVGAVRWVLPPG